jgi:hypothetical protein
MCSRKYMERVNELNPLTDIEDADAFFQGGED